MMRHYLAVLLRRVADRLDPPPVVQWTIGVLPTSTAVNGSSATWTITQQ